MIQDEIRALASEPRALSAAKYFKTGPGGYGGNDKFLGMTVPEVRSIAKKYWQLPFGDVQRLLQSEWHEERLCALLILVYHFEKDLENRKRIYDLFFENIKYVNNWDLVDSSARDIVGKYLLDKPRRQIYLLAKSAIMWERRIAVVATHAFIAKHQFADTFAIVEGLLDDKEDLIHKACGWMLREIYKQSPVALEGFLRVHQAGMPRTMLRYSIERMPQAKRKAYLKGSVKERKVDIPRLHGALAKRVSR